MFCLLVGTNPFIGLTKHQCIKVIAKKFPGPSGDQCKPCPIDNALPYREKLLNSTIHKAAGRHSSWLEPPPGAIPAAGSIHGLWEFQELCQAKSWNSWEP